MVGRLTRNKNEYVSFGNAKVTKENLDLDIIEVLDERYFPNSALRLTTIVIS